MHRKYLLLVAVLFGLITLSACGSAQSHINNSNTYEGRVLNKVLLKSERFILRLRQKSVLMIR